MRYSTSTVPVPVHTRRRYYYEYYEEAILVHTINRFKRYEQSPFENRNACCGMPIAVYISDFNSK